MLLSNNGERDPFFDRHIFVQQRLTGPLAGNQQEGATVLAAKLAVDYNWWIRIISSPTYNGSN